MKRLQDLGPAITGRCCACDRRRTLRNVVMLHKKAPIAGRGWGCLVCHLPHDGALAVLCDSCLELKREIRFACGGYPTEDDRMPIEQLQGEHEHDRRFHPELLDAEAL